MKLKNWSGLNDADDKLFNELTHKYVPAMGMARTIGGELLRCINRITYRYFNDGDTVARYYGGTYNILKGANTYLVNASEVFGFEYHDMKYLSKGDKYIEILFGNIKCLFNFVVETPAVFRLPNNIDTCEVDCPKEDYDEDDDWDYYDVHDDDWYDDEF